MVKDEIFNGEGAGSYRRMLLDPYHHSRGSHPKEAL